MFGYVEGKIENEKTPTYRAASGSTRTDRPPGNETANNGIADLNNGNLTITSGSDHVVVAATFTDGSGWVILDTWV